MKLLRRAGRLFCIAALVAAELVVQAAPQADAACQITNVTLTISPPNASTVVSTYNGAPLIVRRRSTVVFNGFVTSTGRVVIGELRSGRRYKVSVGSVLQPVHWPFGDGGGPAVDFSELPNFTKALDIPCTTRDNVTFNVPPPKNATLFGRLVNDCGMGGQSVSGVKVRVRSVGSGLAVTKTTDAQGLFGFTDLDPRRVFYLEIFGQGAIATDLLASRRLTTIGTPGQVQRTIIHDDDGIVCNILPDPP